MNIDLQQIPLGGVWFARMFLMELELELESNSIFCLVGRKWNWNPISYPVWFVDMSDEFDFRNAK